MTEDCARMVSCQEMAPPADLIEFDSPEPPPLRETLPVVQRVDDGLSLAVSASHPIAHLLQDRLSPREKSLVLYEVSQLRREVSRCSTSLDDPFLQVEESTTTEYRREEHVLYHDRLFIADPHLSSTSFSEEDFPETVIEEDCDVVDLDGIILDEESGQKVDILVDISPENGPKTPPISTISELDDESIALDEEFVVKSKDGGAALSNGFDEVSSWKYEIRNVDGDEFEWKTQDSWQKNDSGQILSTDWEVGKSAPQDGGGSDNSYDSAEDSQSPDGSPLAFRYNFESQENSGAAFVLDDQVDEWIDGPFEEDQEEDGKPPHESGKATQNEKPSSSKTEDDRWLDANLNITETGETVEGRYDTQLNGKEHADDKNGRCEEINSDDSDLKKSRKKLDLPIPDFVQKDEEDYMNVDGSDLEEPACGGGPERTGPPRKSLLKKGPCSGARVTFNSDITLFSEEFPDGERAALRAPAPSQASTDFNSNGLDPPSQAVDEIINDQFIRSHWLDLMMGDASFLEKKQEPPRPSDPKTNSQQTREEPKIVINQEEEEEESQVPEVIVPRQTVKEEKAIIQEPELPHQMESVKADSLAAEKETRQSEASVTWSDTVQVNHIPESDKSQPEPARNDKTSVITENDFLDHVRLSKQCQLSPEEFKDLGSLSRSNNEVRHFIEMSALRRSLIRGTDIRKKARERPRSASSVEDSNLTEKLRMLTEDCLDEGSNGDCHSNGVVDNCVNGNAVMTRNHNRPTTEHEDKKDELELFVQQNVPRIEKIKKRYSLTEEDPTYGFSRLPSVRGIRPKYGTTTDILKQLQSQLQPHPLASHVGPITWPYVPETQSHPPDTRAAPAPSPHVNGKERSTSYPEIKLRPKRGREGLQKSTSAAGHFSSKEERGAPEGASSSPKILQDGWRDQECYGALKRNSLPGYGASRAGYYQSAPSLQPLYEQGRRGACRHPPPSHYGIHHQLPCTAAPKYTRTPPPYSYHQQQYHNPQQPPLANPQYAKDSGVVYYTMRV